MPFDVVPVKRAVFSDRDGVLNESEIREGGHHGPRRVKIPITNTRGESSIP